MSICKKKTVELFLSGVFCLMGVFSHASEAQNSQTEILSNDNPCIFIAKNAKIYGKEHLYTKQNTPKKIVKTDSKTKSKTIEPVKNEITEQKSAKEIVVPDFPFNPSSLDYSYIGKELAVPVSQQRHHEYQTICKGNYGNTHSGVENSSLSLYLPEQRQKFSTASIQYGILTSFIPNSPPS